VPENVEATVRVAFSTDDLRFGGHGRVAHSEYKIAGKGFLIYLPSRSGIVL
jgi:hypothetical protein